jgi:hypothetical protein
VLTAPHLVQLLVRAHPPTFGRQGAQLRYVEAVEKPVFHRESGIKMAQDFLRHF